MIEAIILATTSVATSLVATATPIIDALNPETLFTLSAVDLLIVPIVVGLVAVIKGGFNIPARLAPVVSIVLASALTALVTPVLSFFIIKGILIGLAASGLYSGGKAIANG